MMQEVTGQHGREDPALMGRAWSSPAAESAWDREIWGGDRGRGRDAVGKTPLGRADSKRDAQETERKLQKL